MNRSMSVDLGLLVIRLWVGWIGVYHGSQKLFSWFGGPGPEGFAGYLETLSVPMPRVSAYLAGGAEFFGGLMVALGLLPRLGALLMIAVMVVAATTAHRGKFDVGQGGSEYALTIALVLAGLALTGPGRLAIYDWPGPRRGKAA